MYTSIKMITTGFCLLLVLSNPLLAQEVKPDTRPPLLKEDALNRYQSGEIRSLDLLQALDFMDVRIHKFDIGRFDQKYQLHILAETYEQGEVIQTDTMLAWDNEYGYFVPGKEDFFLDYIDQLKFITKSDDNRSEVRLYTYALSTKTEVELKKWDEEQFYNWRFFGDTHWALDKKIPLMVFASSWEDKRRGFHRFCGVVTLQEGKEDTEELLRESPTYVLFSYRISTVE